MARSSARAEHPGAAAAAGEKLSSTVRGEQATRVRGEQAEATTLASRGTATARSLSRPRATNPDAAEAFAFDQKAVLDQDRALIEQLTQRTQRREGSVVRKPPPPPKVTPYKSRVGSGASPGSPETANGADTAPPSPTAATATATGNPTPEPSSTFDEPPEGLGPPLQMAGNRIAAPEPVSPARPAGADRTQVVSALEKPAAVEPVVPRAGDLFTAADIDSIMDRFGSTDKDAALSMPVAARGADPGQCTQNFGDISQDFFKTHRLEVPAKWEEPGYESAGKAQASDQFQVPQRRALKQQIQAIDSWLEDDFSAREQLGQRQPPSGRLGRSLPTGSVPASPKASLSSTAKCSRAPVGTAEAEIIQKLENLKKRKELGEKVSPAVVKEIAVQVKPLLPEMSLEQLVKTLRLFTSARYEDHDLYLRILGEIPVQVRGIAPEMLTTCLRVLWRLRLHEETYVELFSMEAMNMIRAARRPTTRAPRRPPAPSRLVDAAATAAAASGAMPSPVAPPAPSQPEVCAPFNASQLVHIGNALSQLGAKYLARFMEVFQEQLAIAIPQLTQEECELVSPALATSQLMHDPLRRAFLERCAQVDAGAKMPTGGGSAAPDIASYQQEAGDRRRRLKNFRNIFVFEASVRKETFSFFTSLPAEVRTYLDRVHADAAALSHEGTGTLSAQVAAVLDQLGVSCELNRMAGPTGLHVVAKATNPRSGASEIVYECSDVGAYCAPRQDDRGAAPQLTTVTRLRHKLLQRLGIQLEHINVWEWQHLSEAQRVNYMVKLQSLQ
eukprot:CAMPEP_0115050794 /NCGR_PEP_ID=MMETSP0227-20121206/1982_1 /TAXON_ID=89957 /ORGANISM="Polarella glacialis, Strain CCMP 1383" /LENGTH=784 /DNA_ID=CAMNT_0002434689 /DNA_START=101 /DNA_END=2455 /DNA_ORIENTATION=-